MKKRTPFGDYIESELDMAALDAIAAERRRRRREALEELLHCLDELKRLLSNHSPYGRIPPKDRRE